MNGLLLTLFKWSESISFVVIIAFIIQYTLQAKWWRNPLGRSIVLESVAILLVLFPETLHFYLHISTATSTGFAWYSLVSFSMIPVIMLSRMVSFERLRRSFKRTDDDEHSSLP
jgi:hypothetical protein